MPVRTYSPNDWPSLCEIHDAARKLELSSAGLLDAFLTLEQTAEGEGLFDGDLLVYDSGSKVQGFVAFADNELTWLYVDPTAARQGIGRALLKQAIAACGGNMTTEVLVGNDSALQLYLSEGFRVLKRVDGKLTGNESFPASGYVLERRTSEA
jgi:ribosomal protein S18 acetylase RimI-like enzyme